MGMYCNVFAASPREVETLLNDPDSIDNWQFSAEVDLQKAWHGLHYLLSGRVWQSVKPLGFLVSGGRTIRASDSYWEPLRLFTPDAVRGLADALSAVSDEDLWSRFDAKRMNELAVYPVIWDEPETDLREEYLGYFHDLKSFISKAASDGAAIIIQTPKLGGIDDTQ